ncbi:hypothetical protein RJ640_030956 [Escallonia rubra]|uniref:Transposase (putative) gypsy type domain-containing protein n=1 Tax=Escallonia rubra TaxID=112253 RepID=A0AA88UE60_9ASTE|nr:hypothetical protein RJ640_030956 [Escallonia rubra]
MNVASQIRGGYTSTLYTWKPCTSFSPCYSLSSGSTCSSQKVNQKSSSPQVGTSTPRIRVESSTPQASTSVPHRDALGDVKDEAEEKFDEDTWFTLDEKMNKMSKESIIELLEEFLMPPPFSARVPTLQEPANYDTDLETSVYEGQIRSGYRIPMHPFAVAFFNYYKMALGQLVPNGWRKLVGLIYLVQTSGYPVTVHDFMRLYLEVCFIKNVAKSVGCGQVANGSSPESGTIFVKIMKKKGFLAPNATTKKLLDHIKRRNGLNIDEPLTDQEMRHAGLIPPAPTIPVPPTPVIESQVVLGGRTRGFAAGMSSSRTPSLQMAGKGEGAKGDFLGLLQRASKGKRKEGAVEDSSPIAKRPCALTPHVPLLMVEDLPIDKDPIFRPRWTIKRDDSGMPSSHISAQHLAHGVLLSEKLILENQPHEAFTMAHV